VGCERSGCGDDLGRVERRCIDGWRGVMRIVRTGGRRVESVELEVAGGDSRWKMVLAVVATTCRFDHRVDL